jgi:hypothetical protein
MSASAGAAAATSAPKKTATRGIFCDFAFFFFFFFRLQFDARDHGEFQGLKRLFCDFFGSRVDSIGVPREKARDVF